MSERIDSAASRPLAAENTRSIEWLDTSIVALLAIFLFSSAFSIAAMNIAYGSACAVWIGRMIVRRRLEIESTPLDWYFLAYLLAEALSTVFAYNTSQSLLYAYRRLTLIPIVYVVCSNVHTRAVLRLLIVALVASIGGASLWSLRDIILHLHEYVIFGRRLQEFQMYMTTGGLMMFGLLLLLPFVVHPHTPPRVRWIAVASMIPIGTSLLFTFTRSSWLGFLAGVFVIGAFRAKRVVLAIGLIVIALVLVASPQIRERMVSAVDPYHPNNVSRLEMWETGFAMFLDHPALGIGDIGTEQLWDRYAAAGSQPWGHLHNNLIMWLVTLGGVGFAVLVALFVKLWITVNHIERRVRHDWLLGSVALGCLAMMAGFHVNGLFEWNFGDAEIIMVVWAIVGITFAVEKIETHEHTAR
jgi:O-antigen ligase